MINNSLLSLSDPLISLFLSGFLKCFSPLNHCFDISAGDDWGYINMTAFSFEDILLSLGSSQAKLLSQDLVEQMEEESSLNLTAKLVTF